MKEYKLWSYKPTFDFQNEPNFSYFERDNSNTSPLNTPTEEVSKSILGNNTPIKTVVAEPKRAPAKETIKVKKTESNSPIEKVRQKVLNPNDVKIKQKSILELKQKPKLTPKQTQFAQKKVQEVPKSEAPSKVEKIQKNTFTETKKTESLQTPTQPLKITEKKVSLKELQNKPKNESQCLDETPTVIEKIEEISSIIQKETLQEPKKIYDCKTLVHAVSESPEALLKVDFKNSNLTEEQKKILARSALASLFLGDHKYDTTTQLQIQKQAQEILPQNLSKISTSDQLQKNKAWERLNTDRNGLQPKEFRAFYKNNLDISYDQLHDYCQYLKQGSKMEGLISVDSVMMAAVALLQIEYVAKNIIANKLLALQCVIRKYFDVEGVQKLLTYCVAYHNNNLDIAKNGCGFVHDALFVVDSSIKGAPELQECWIDLGVKKRAYNAFNFMRDDFPPKYRELIANDYQIISQQSKHDPFIVMYAGPQLKKDPRYTLLLQNIIIILGRTPPQEKQAVKLVEEVKSYCKKNLPTKNSKIGTQEELKKFLIQYPIEKLLFMEESSFIKLLEENFSLSVMQFSTCLMIFSQLTKQTIPKDQERELFHEMMSKIDPANKMSLLDRKRLYTKFSAPCSLQPTSAWYTLFPFIALMGLSEIYLSIFKSDVACDTETLSLIVKRHSKNKEIVMAAVTKDALGRPIYFADDSIRLAPENKIWMRNAIVDMFRVYGENAINLPLFPKHLLNDLEVMRYILKLDKKFITCVGTELVKSQEFTDYLLDQIAKALENM